jgi:hypothetical protein
MDLGPLCFDHPVRARRFKHLSDVSDPAPGLNLYKTIFTRCSSLKETPRNACMLPYLD